jgi:hypothetical protein
MLPVYGLQVSQPGAVFLSGSFGDDRVRAVARGLRSAVLREKRAGQEPEGCRAMRDFAAVDLSLFGCFETQEALSAFPVETAAQTAERVLLERKSADALAGACDVSGAEELRLLLNEMTREMRAQFLAFRALRTAAERTTGEGGGEGTDDAAQKLARADLKAATDAMSLIVRTLEKVDSLQRQLARDRAAEAERQADEGGYEEAMRTVEALIEARASERAQARFMEWQRNGRADGGEPDGAAWAVPGGADSG